MKIIIRIMMMMMMMMMIMVVNGNAGRDKMQRARSGRKDEAAGCERQYLEWKGRSRDFASQLLNLRSYHASPLW